MPDFEGLLAALTRALPGAAGVTGVTLLVWDRKLDTFEALSSGETQARRIRSEPEGEISSDARYLVSEGQLLETPGKEGNAILVPLQARSGLVGMLVLDGPAGRRHGPPLSSSEARVLSMLANRAALALENHLYQRELIASERMAALGTMAGMLAHDFRGPMTVIRGYAETLLEPVVSEGEVQSRAATIVEMVDRLERMTTETLDFARGGGRLARRTLPLLPLLDDIAAGLSEEFPGLIVVRQFELPSETMASLDVDKLRRALGNIAANALDAMGGRGRLLLQASLRPSSDRSGPKLVLVVADEGPGVPSEIRERIFEPFVTKGKKQGTGLGLAVSRRFVEDHAGSLELLPEGPGARFRIVLPLNGAAAPPAPAV